MDVPLYFYIAFSSMDRLAPGSDETTLRAISKIGLDKDLELTILDIGCGVGAGTLLLADYFKNANIEAIDLFKHYLKVLDDKIIENNLDSRVRSYEMNMSDPDFPNEEFDIVFAEASIYILGFKKALKEWKRLLKDNSYMIVSDVSWIKRPSGESKNFWKDTYDEIDTIENKISQIKDEGYEFVDYVVLPKDDWNSYYNKLEKNLNSLGSDMSAKDFVDQLKREMGVYRNNCDDYSYVFYIMKKADGQ